MRPLSLESNSDEARFLMANGLPGSFLLDSIVFNKVKEATGGRLRFCFNGAAPIARETQEFISLAVTPMVSGYGSTETAAYLSSISFKSNANCWQNGCTM
jgi:long-subunit acyl-CoA synthetase (AMP-forming)